MSTKYLLAHYRSNTYRDREKGDHVYLFNFGDTVAEAIGIHCKAFKTEPLKIAMAPNEYFVFVVVYGYGEGVGRIHDIIRLDCFQTEEVAG